MTYTKREIQATADLLDAKVDLSRPLPADLQMAAIKLIAERKKGPKPDDLMRLWNENRNPNLRECIKLNDKRSAACRARLREYPNADDWMKFLAYINTSPWCLGLEKNPKYPNWKANFDFFIKPGSMLNFLEGAYSRKGSAPQEDARERYGSELERRNELHD